jgi:hypothetical protein
MDYAIDDRQMSSTWRDDCDLRRSCKLLGYEKPPDLSEFTRNVIIETAIRLSENGTKSVENGIVLLCRERIAAFG